MPTSLIKKTSKTLSDIIPGLGKFTFDPDLGSVFITSGSGVIGHRLALRLLDAGIKDVRVGIWRGDREVGDKTIGQKAADNLAAKGAKVIDFDWRDPDNFASVLKGVTTVFCNIPHLKGWQEYFPAFLTCAKKAKVEHFLKTSFFQADNLAGEYRKVPFVHFHGNCDDILRFAKDDSRISYSILKTTHHMSTPLIQQGTILRERKEYVTASYGMGVNYVSPNDVADAALVVLLNLKNHRNKEYTLTGRGPTKDRDVAKLLSKFYGEEIKHVELGYHDYKAFELKLGYPSWLAKDRAAFEKVKATGIDELPTSYTTDLEELIGRKPEKFEEFLENKEALKAALLLPIT